MAIESNFTRADRVAERMTDTMVRKELLPAYKQSLDTIRQDVAMLYEKYSKDGTLSMADASKYNRLANLEKGITAEMSRLGSKQTGITKKTIKDVYQESFYRGAFAIESEAQLKLRFGELPTKQIEAALVNPMDRIGWPDRTKEQARVATRQIKEEITRGIIQGKGYPDVARQVKERMDMAAYRAERIVRTEAHRAREEGKLASLEHAHNQGVDMEKAWSSTLDGDTRDTHQALDGQVVPMYDEQGEPGVFTSPTGNTAEYPGGFGVPEEDIHCRCAVRGQIKGYSPELRRSREEGIIPYQTYPEYAKAKGWPVKYKGPEPRVAAFVPAKTIAEAEAFAKNKLNINADYSKFHIDMANEVNREIGRAKETFGSIDKLKNISTFPKGMSTKWLGAYSESNKIIWLRNVGNKNSMDKWAKEAGLSKLSGFKSTGAKMHTIRHEIGHAVGKTMIEKSPMKGTMINALRKETQMEVLKTRKGTAEYGNLLSKYGMTNGSEFIAESVAEYMAGNPRALAKKVVDILLGDY